MLVNAKMKPKARTKIQQRFKPMTHDKYCRNGARRIRKHFNWIMHPYKPCGYEYSKDTRSNFKGVYFDTFGILRSWLQELIYAKVYDDLVAYGNVDNASQAIDEYERGVQEHPERFFGDHIILLHPVWKSNADGYRWHKSGYYSGKANVQCEYFDDEPDEKLVMVYHYTVVRVGQEKEEDFGNVRSDNLGRIESIRKLRMAGLNNLAKLAKQYEYVMFSGVNAMMKKRNGEWHCFDVDIDDNNNVVDVEVVDQRLLDHEFYIFSEMRENPVTYPLPDLDWTK